MKIRKEPADAVPLDYNACLPALPVTFAYTKKAAVLNLFCMVLMIALAGFIPYAWHSAVADESYEHMAEITILGALLPLIAVANIFMAVRILCNPVELTVDRHGLTFRDAGFFAWETVRHIEYKEYVTRRRTVLPATTIELQDLGTRAVRMPPYIRLLPGHFSRRGDRLRIRPLAHKGLTPDEHTLYPMIVSAYARFLAQKRDMLLPNGLIDMRDEGRLAALDADIAAITQAAPKPGGKKRGPPVRGPRQIN